MWRGNPNWSGRLQRLQSATNARLGVAAVHLVWKTSSSECQILQILWRDSSAACTQPSTHSCLFSHLAISCSVFAAQPTDHR